MADYAIACCPMRFYVMSSPSDTQLLPEADTWKGDVLEAKPDSLILSRSVSAS